MFVNKKSIALAAAGTLIMGTVLSGCQTKAAGGDDTKDAGELNVYVWTEYMPQTVFDAFEEKTGIKVNVSTYSSNEDMYAKVKGSNEGVYDIVVPTDYMVKMMIDQDYLMELDKAKIPNLSNIDDSFLDKSFDPGNKHSVPYMAGAAVLCVNKTMVDEDITSYSQIFDPKYKDSIVVLDDFRGVIGFTAKGLGFSLSPTADNELAKVGEKLKELKPNIKLFDSDSPKTPMLNGETSIGYMWNAEAAICLEESDDFEVVFPKEGCYMFIDNLCVLKGAKNADNAQEFLNFVLEPETSKLVSDEFPYLNPNKAAVELLDDSYKNNPASNIDPAVIANGEYIQDLEGADLEKYDALWTELTK